MNESLRTASPEGEAPVNPYSLLEAVNDSSDTVNTSWLIFIGIMSYLLITVAGVTHKDLLLSQGIHLPILQVGIDLPSFFLDFQCEYSGQRLGCWWSLRDNASYA